MPSVDAVRPGKRSSKPKRPAALAPGVQPSASPTPIDNSHRRLGWLLVGIIAAVIVVAWVVLARTNVIFPKPNAEQTVSQSGGLGADLKGFFADIGRMFRREKPGTSTNADIQQLEEQIFPQFTNKQ